ncbi:MAG: hypothetical protein HZC24_03620 [Rhodocyclales bacterium]|nr:hypothetical protein [Rhodocyclales bacterium]
MNQVKKRVLFLVKKGALTEAVTVAAEFARRNPGLAECYGLLSQTEEIAGYTRAAIKTVSQAIALAPQEPAYRFQRGRLHLKVNAVADGLDDLDSVIEIEKSLAHAYYTEAANACREEALGRVQRHGIEPAATRNSPSCL